MFVIAGVKWQQSNCTGEITRGDANMDGAFLTPGLAAASDS